MATGGDSIESAPQVVQPPDEFSQKSDTKTKALEVGGHLLWVVPQILADRSPVFKKLLMGEDFKESQLEQVHIGGERNVKEFILFLRFMTGSVGPAKSIWPHYPALLKLADEYGAKSVITTIFTHMVDTRLEKLDWRKEKDALEILDCLSLAYKFGNLDALTAFFKLFQFVDYETVENKPEKISTEVWGVYTELQMKRWCPGKKTDSRLHGVKRGCHAAVTNGKDKEYTRKCQCCKKEASFCGYWYTCVRCQKIFCHGCNDEIEDGTFYFACEGNKMDCQCSDCKACGVEALQKLTSILK